MALNIETTTSWWIHKSEFREDTITNLRARMSILSFKQNEETPKAIFEEGDYIIVPKVRKQMLDSILRKPLYFQDQRAPVVNNTHNWGKIKFDPLPHQIDILNKIKGIFSDKHQSEQRVCLCAKPGLGKTYMTANVIASLGLKFVFIVYSGKLVDQTYEEFCKYIGKDGLLPLKRGGDFEEINWKKVKGVFMTHAMLRSLIQNYGMHTVVKKLLLDMGCNLKVIDEFDREVGSTYQLECFGNFSHNLYLTGTKFKNLKPDDQIFQSIYRHAHTFGDDVKIPNMRNAIVIRWKFNPAKDEYAKMQLFDEQLFKTYYNNYLAHKDVLLDYIMWKFYKSPEGIIKKIIDEGDSVVIYCGRIESCETVKAKLIKNFSINEDDIGIYNSSIKASDKKDAETKQWIVTTTESMGRGYDNKKLRILIFLEFNFGISSYIQNISRVARVGGKEGYVIEGLDMSFWKIEANHKKKISLGIYREYFKSVTYHYIPDGIQARYIHGYRADSDRAKEIKAKELKKKKSAPLHKQI